MYHNYIRKHCFRTLDNSRSCRYPEAKSTFQCESYGRQFNRDKSGAKKPTILPGFRPGESVAKESQSKTWGGSRIGPARGTSLASAGYDELPASFHSTALGKAQSCRQYFPDLLAECRHGSTRYYAGISSISHTHLLSCIYIPLLLHYANIGE